MKIFRLPLTLFLLILLPATQYAQDNVFKELKEIAVIERMVLMPMRDGIKLYSEIFRPKTDEPVPVILRKTPYNFNKWWNGEETTGGYEAILQAVKQGYAFVMQTERGRHHSQGEWDILGAPTTDGYDAFTWLADQSWCNGKIATEGCSSSAEWQMAVAALDHPAHSAMIPAGYGAGVGRIGNYYEQGNWFRGGAWQMWNAYWLYIIQNDRIRPTFPIDASRDDLIRVSKSYFLGQKRPKVEWKEAYWHLPVQDIIKNVDGPIGIYEDMIRRKPDDPAWYEGGLYHDDMDFGVPSLWIVTWYDMATSPNLALVNHVRENALDPEVRNNQYLIIAPDLHCNYSQSSEKTIVGERNVGDARLHYDSITNGWLEYWLKDKNQEFLNELPRVQYYTMGSDKWQNSDTWPPEGMEMHPWYLDSDGNANTLDGDGRLSNKMTGRKDNPDGFIYDPANPVPSYGGGECLTGGLITPGSFDQSEMEEREDILVYSTEPLKEGIEVSGFIEATLYISSNVKDTDITLKLIDVYPDGKAYNLDETILRVRYREGYDKEVFMEKGNVYKIEMSPMSTSNYFEEGHRIRIEVSSSNFPHFDRNLNTGGNNFDESEGIVAHNNIHHSKAYPSQIRLPVMKK